MRQHTEMINAPADSLKCINIVTHINLEVLINLSYSFLSTFLQNSFYYIDAYSLINLQNQTCIKS